MAQGAAYVYVEPATGWRNSHRDPEAVSNDGRTADSLGSVGRAYPTERSLRPRLCRCPRPRPTPVRSTHLAAFPAMASRSPRARPPAQTAGTGAPSGSRSARATLATTGAQRCAARLTRRTPPRASTRCRPRARLRMGVTVAANGIHTIFGAAANSAGYIASPSARSFKIDTCQADGQVRRDADVHPQGRAAWFRRWSATRPPGRGSDHRDQANVRKVGSKTATPDRPRQRRQLRPCTVAIRSQRPRVPTSFPFGYSFFRDGTMFTSLKAKKVPKGATLAVTCKGPNCPLKRRTLHPAKKVKVCKGNGAQAVQDQVGAVASDHQRLAAAQGPASEAQDQGDAHRHQAEHDRRHPDVHDPWHPEEGQGHRPQLPGPRLQQARQGLPLLAGCLTPISRRLKGSVGR